MAKTAEERLIDMRIAEARRKLAQLQAEMLVVGIWRRK